MGSKLEYRFLLTKIVVVVLDVMIEDCVGVIVPALDDSWWLLWHVGGGIILLFYHLLKPVNFPKSILDFPIHQKSLPIAQNLSNRQSFI